MCSNLVWLITVGGSYSAKDDDIIESTMLTELGKYWSKL